MRRLVALSGWLLVSVLATVAGVRTSGAATQTADSTLGYPRLAMYGGVTGSGYPFYNAPADSTLDPTVLEQYAKYDLAILDINPIGPYRPDILAELRSRRPGMKILGYVTAGLIWPAESADSLHHFPTRYNHLIRDLGGFLYNSLDGQEFPYNVNLALRDAGGRFVVAERLADLFYDAVVGTGLWDGIFLDTFCFDPTWLQDATHRVDYVRAGYPTLASFVAGYAAGTDTLANRLRRLAGPSPIMVGNCAESEHTSVFNGWMRENFPFQGPGTWAGNVLADPHGYLADDRNFRGPPMNLLTIWLPSVDPGQYSADSRRKVRFGLATASLGQGFSPICSQESQVGSVPYFRWWYDEYAVDVVSGQSATDLAHTHWLGLPLGAPYQVIWAGTNPDASTNPGFETDVTTGWRFASSAVASATLTRVISTSAVGSASARITIATAVANDWEVYFATTSTLPLAAGGTYAATFWARASQPRSLRVAMALPAGGDIGGQLVTIGTTWTHYQVILKPASSASAALAFFLGAQAGDVWLDDAHLQQGATSVWRRDFDNGIVVLNPSDAALQVPLGGSFRRILGTVDRVVNDGSTITVAPVPAGDALFLLGSARDTFPPAAIRNGRLVR